jgi:hypothetical protein
MGSLGSVETVIFLAFIAVSVLIGFVFVKLIRKKD